MSFEQRKRDKVIKHCQESEAVKIDKPGEGFRTVFSIGWYEKSKKLAWKNTWAANYIIGTLVNARKRKLTGVATNIKGVPLILKITEAVDEIRSMGNGVKMQHEKRP